MSLPPARQQFLGLLKRRSGLRRVQEGPFPQTKADLIREAAKGALVEFQSMSEIAALDEVSRELLSRLFLRNFVLLHVASNLDPKKAVELNGVTNKVMAPLLRGKPKLRIV